MKKKLILPRVCWAGVEVQTNQHYKWNNLRRPAVRRVVLQRTLSGQGFYEDIKGRKTVPVGCAMLFRYGEASCYGYSELSTSTYHLSYLNIDPGELLNPVVDLIRLEFGSVLKFPSESEAAFLFEDLVSQYRTMSFLNVWQESEALLKLFHALAREQGEKVVPRDAVEKGYAWIQNRFRSPFNLKTLAEECEVSREHFIRSFQKRYGKSPGSLLRSLRLRYAREILETTRLPVHKIALESGFMNSNSFCRAYRREFGCSAEKSRKI